MFNFVFLTSEGYYGLSAETKKELGLTENQIRLSVGIEDIKDLIDDSTKPTNMAEFQCIAAKVMWKLSTTTVRLLREVDPWIPNIYIYI